ncbi:MAG: hypothetical protein RLZZ598_1378, partial [Pseudomonadota bacterium]
MRDDSQIQILGAPSLPALPGEAHGWESLISRHGISAVAAATHGRFALAMKQADGSACLASDRFASHSLCWAMSDGQLRFSERADALGATELDPQALFDYLFFHNIPSPRTVFKGVSRLPAGHVAECKGGQVQVSPYWRPAFKPSRNPSFTDLKAEFKALLRDATQRSLGTGTPACFLSGGTDSSTVTGFVREVAGAVDTYSIGFDAEGYDEMSYARIAAKHFDSTHHEYYVTPDDLVRSIAEVAASYDQPFG